jgi:D-3-phosphoglycerate dehydrogenase / 2-oxoglutarate reductase
MKPMAYLINTARADIVEREALYSALKSRKISGAVLDVFWDEPIDPQDPLLQHDNVLITPHLGRTLRDTLNKSFSRLSRRLEPYIHSIVD